MKKSFIALYFLFSLVTYGQKHLMYDFYYYTNPQHVSKTYNKIIVFSNLDQKTNKKLKKMGKKEGFSIVMSDEILPPIKSYTDEEIQSILKNNSIDGIIYFTHLNTTQTSSSTYGTYTIPRNGGIGTVQAFTKTRRYFYMDLALVEPDSKDLKEFYCTGGYGPDYSVNVNVKLFKKCLKEMRVKDFAKGPIKN